MTEEEEFFDLPGIEDPSGYIERMRATWVEPGPLNIPGNAYPVFYRNDEPCVVCVDCGRGTYIEMAFVAGTLFWAGNGEGYSFKKDMPVKDGDEPAWFCDECTSRIARVEELKEMAWKARKKNAS